MVAKLPKRSTYILVSGTLGDAQRAMRSGTGIAVDALGQQIPAAACVC